LKQPDYYYDGRTLPFSEGSFDGVLCTQVLEHVSHPQELLLEISRVLRPGGILILSAPFLWQEHEEPYDFFRFSSFGMRRLLSCCGLDEISMMKTTGSIETIAQAASVYVATNCSLPLKGWGRLKALLFCFPLQLGGLLWQFILPDKRQLFLDLIVVAKRSEK
jgi:SAM-dependent methyltransferase